MASTLVCAIPDVEAPESHTHAIRFHLGHMMETAQMRAALEESDQPVVLVG